jgi:hypothetical protein
VGQGLISHVYGAGARQKIRIGHQIFARGR